MYKMSLSFVNNVNTERPYTLCFMLTKVVDDTYSMVFNVIYHLRLFFMYVRLRAIRECVPYCWSARGQMSRDNMT